MTASTMHATDIVAYTYQADTWYPQCLVTVMVNDGTLSPAARSMDPEAALDQHAAANAIDREDEYSFDSDDFPKVVFSSQVESDDETCSYCDEPLVG